MHVAGNDDTVLSAQFGTGFRVRPGKGSARSRLVLPANILISGFVPCFGIPTKMG